MHVILYFFWLIIVQMSLKRALYSFVLYLLFPFVILRLFWRGFSNPAYRQRISERLALMKFDNNKPVIWIHAVSVGETIAAKPLIEALISHYPAHCILVTTMTPTGSDQVKSLFSNRVAHVYFPYDLPEIIFRFLNRIKPQILIVVETEIWPNLYAACNKRDIPIVIVNARLSERSTKSYQKIKGLISETLSYVNTIAVRSEKDAQRYIKLGANDKKIKIVGNIKFDIGLDKPQIEQGRLRKAQWGIDRPVWVAASTHAGEDEVILDVYVSLLKEFPDLLLVLIPRHPERFEKVYLLCEDLKRSEIRTYRHSALDSYENLEANIIIGDSMGEMHSWFATADIVFIGGSIVKTGGHNPLEAIVQGVPVVSGQYMFNFEDIVSDLEGSGLLTICQSPKEIEKYVAEILQQPVEKSHEFTEKSQKIVQQLHGVTARLSEIISKYLSNT